MAVQPTTRESSVFATAAIVLAASYFAFVLFCGWVVLQYGMRTADYGWQAHRVGDGFYVSLVAERGPAAGWLRTGDRILEVNGVAVSTESGLGLSLRSIAGSSLYTMRLMRSGEKVDVWLRSQTRAGFAFFQERLPLIGSSAVIFFAGMAMLLNWSSKAARYGFLAAMCAAFRMGAWAILPLGAYFQPKEFPVLFVFWLPAALALPMALLAVLYFSPRHTPGAGWRIVSGSVIGAAVVLVLFGAVRGSLPVLVPEGLALVSWDHVEFIQNSAPIQVGASILLLGCLGAAGYRIWTLYQSRLDGDLRRRLEWLAACGLFFAIPAAWFEIGQWFGLYQGAIAWSWLPAMMAVSFSYLVTAEMVMKPATVVRGIVGMYLPERVFRKLDRKYFPLESKVEADLLRVCSEIDTCTSLDQLHEVLTNGLERALRPEGMTVTPEVSEPETLDLGPKRTGEPYTRREQKLIGRAVSRFLAAQQQIPNRMEKRADGEDARLNLMRECPRCGNCYDGDVIHCPHDGEVPVLRLPVEPVVDGKYRLERLIGRGGMGAVYAGKDTRLNRRIAIKIMLSELFGHESALRRFEREAKMAAMMNHPNIVQIHDFGRIGSMGAYLVMEYVEGRSWREELNHGGPIPLATCMPWVMQLLDGIASAHSNGIIHRDLKPENLLLTGLGGHMTLVKILDFGLAKMQLLGFSQEDRLSLGMQAIGTVGYVPREQLVGGVVDARSDIYAIGRIIVETLNGELPESGVGAIEGPLASVLLKAMADHKDDRYGSIAEFRKELVEAAAVAGLLC